jgi:hypothetical protein
LDSLIVFNDKNRNRVIHFTTLPCRYGASSGEVSDAGKDWFQAMFKSVLRYGWGRFGFV